MKTFNQLLFTQALNDAIFNHKIQKQLKGASLRDISKEIGISVSTLSRLTNGKMPDVPTLGRVLEWMGVSFEMFMSINPVTNR